MANPPADRDRLLSTVSLAQLTVGIVGMLVAVRRHRSYDFLMLHGHPENVGRESLSMGTALSAPFPMLVAQGVAGVRLGRRSTDRERVVLGGLGVAMVGGYLGESLVRSRLQPSNWDAVETPVVVAGIGLAAAMAVIAFVS